MRELYDEGLTDGEIAKRVDSDKDRVRRWRVKEKLPSNYLKSGEQVEREYVQSISKDDWPAGLPRPIQVNIPERTHEQRRSDNLYIQVSLSDSHFPFHDPAYNEVVYQVIADLCPDLVVHHGDLLDCYSISRYEKDPKHRVSLQEEITMAARHLGEIANVSPFAERLLIGGNHEDRLRRLVWDMAKGLPEREVIRLPAIWENLSWEKLLGLESMGWEWIDGKRILFDKLILKHGSVVRKKSAYTASGEYEKYGKSGMSGHTHRVGAYYHTDHNGPHAWFELGCGCQLDPDYCEDPDWQQSFAVVTWSEDRSRYSVEQVIVHEGRAIFRGKSYGV
jgi:predicted phosphodiesterase